MNHEWRIIVQEEVQQDGKIPLPEEVKSVVGFNNDVFNASVHFNYERNANYIILSRHGLRESNYVHVGRYQVHDIEMIEESGGRIWIPEGVDPAVKSHFQTGTRVNYMAYAEMIEKDNPAVFLLSNTQFQRLLPTDVRGSVTQYDDEDEVRQTVFDLPAFLRAP